MKEKSKIPSPCISVCSVDEDTGLCRGCLRTLREIADWDAMNDAEKRETTEILRGRRKEADASVALTGEHGKTF